LSENISYTIEEIASILKVSKLTVYDLIKKNELSAYRVGRQMRIDLEDLNNYKNSRKNNSNNRIHKIEQLNPLEKKLFIISGQDVALDILASHLSKKLAFLTPLRLNQGSLNSLVAFYQNQCNLVSLHLYDGDTDSYNVPFAKKFLTGTEYIHIHLLSRWAGFYVEKGNPKNIQTFEDLTREDVQFVNREKGAGIRVLLDEHLRINDISKKDIRGYEDIETNHVAVATKVKNKQADVGLGIEYTAKMVGVDFVPLKKESYDIIIEKTEENKEIIEAIQEILTDPTFQKELQSIGGYDLSNTGKIVYES